MWIVYLSIKIVKICVIYCIRKSCIIYFSCKNKENIYNLNKICVTINFCGKTKLLAYSFLTLATKSFP